MKWTWFLWLLLTAALVPGGALRAQEASPGEVGVEENLNGLVALDTALKDEQGKDVTLRQLIDKPTILTLNYFSCAGICTPLLNGVLRVVNEIQLEPAKDFQVITVSFDDRDTPEIAKTKRENYLRNMKRPFLPNGWRFLTGDAASTQGVADSVGFQFKKVYKEESGEESKKDGSKDQDTGEEPKAERYEFVHPGVIMVLSPEGKVTRYMYGTTFLPADVQMAVGEAVRGEARPTIAKLLKFCFNYDPQGRRYVFSITRFIGAILLVLVFGFIVFLFIQGRIRKKSVSVTE